jgi:hypothetical protein
MPARRRTRRGLGLLPRLWEAAAGVPGQVGSEDASAPEGRQAPPPAGRTGAETGRRAQPPPPEERRTPRKANLPRRWPSRPAVLRKTTVLKEKRGLFTRRPYALCPERLKDCVAAVGPLHRVAHSSSTVPLSCSRRTTAMDCSLRSGVRFANQCSECVHERFSDTDPCCSSDKVLTSRIAMDSRVHRRPR